MVIKGYKIEYERFLNKYHLFYSKEIYGLFACSSDLRVALDAIPKQIEVLENKNGRPV